jgi:hypothetical protein
MGMPEEAYAELDAALVKTHRMLLEAKRTLQEAMMKRGS